MLESDYIAACDEREEETLFEYLCIDCTKEGKEAKLCELHIEILFGVFN